MASKDFSMSLMSFVRLCSILAMNVSSANTKNVSRLKRGATKMAYKIGARIDPWTVPRRILNIVLFVPSMLI
jgi:hypothetical protein